MEEEGGRETRHTSAGQVEGGSGAGTRHRGRRKGPDPETSRGQNPRRCVLEAV